MYCLQNPPVTQYSAHFYQRERWDQWSANELLPEGDPSRNVAPPYNREVHEDRNNLHIEAMTYLENLLSLLTKLFIPNRSGQDIIV